VVLSFTLFATEAFEFAPFCDCFGFAWVDGFEFLGRAGWVAVAECKQMCGIKAGRHHMDAAVLSAFEQSGRREAIGDDGVNSIEREF
jgi:hypothetical protein